MPSGMSWGLLSDGPGTWKDFVATIPSARQRRRKHR
jgi:hypothetical protein